MSAHILIDAFKEKLSPILNMKLKIFALIKIHIFIWSHCNHIFKSSLALIWHVDNYVKIFALTRSNKMTFYYLFSFTPNVLCTFVPAILSKETIFRVNLLNLDLNSFTLFVSSFPRKTFLIMLFWNSFTTVTILCCRLRKIARNIIKRFFMAK